MTQTTFNETDTIDRQEEEAIAGFTPEEPLTLEPEYQLPSINDEEQPEVKAIEERPLPRTLFVMLGVGTVMLTLLAIWLVIKPKSPAVVERPEPTDNEEAVASEPDSRARLAEAKVALALQQQELEASQASALPEESTLQKETIVRESEATAQTEPEAQATPTSATRPVSSAQRSNAVSRPPVQSTRQTRQSSPRITTPPRTPQVQPVASSQPVETTTPEAPIDPFERWEQLANLGHQQGELPELVESYPNPPVQPVSTPVSPPSSSPAVPVMTVGYEPEPVATQPSTLSPGAQGILERRPPTPQRQNKAQEQIQFGTTAPATVSVPLVWDEGSEAQLDNRFAVTLTEDIHTTEGAVALAAGTVFIAEVRHVGVENRFVEASATAMVYTDEEGQVQQQSLPEDMVLIQGQEGSPLIAEGHFDPGDEIAKQNLLISVLSGIGRVGEVFTEPERVSTFSNDGDDSSNTTIIRSRDPQVWSAVLDGFFNPLADRMAERSQQQIEELASRPNLAMIPVGTETSIMINGLINLRTSPAIPLEVIEAKVSQREPIALSKSMSRKQASSPIPPLQPHTTPQPQWVVKRLNF
jgi:hypothetical protein